MKMLNKLRIDGFEGIRDLEIDRLTQFNLIVDNNCGKTSMLEAMQLLRSGSVPNIYRVARLRGNMYISSANSLLIVFICMFPKDISELKIPALGV